MEIHDTDPTTDRGGDPWDQVNSRFSDLTDHFKERYRDLADGRGPSEEEVKDAFTTLLGAWDRVAESVSVALRDPETREQLKAAASSLANALGATLSQLGEEFTARPGTSEEE